MGPSKHRASGPKLLPPLTSLCFPSIKEVLFCVSQDAINLGRTRSQESGGLSAQMPLFDVSGSSLWVFRTVSVLGVMGVLLQFGH